LIRDRIINPKRRIVLFPCDDDTAGAGDGLRVVESALSGMGVSPGTHNPLGYYHLSLNGYTRSALWLVKEWAIIG
jgi:hypothetical protein